MPINFYKKLSYEFWPYQLFYLPTLFYGCFLMIKYRAWCYFTPTNPCMKYAGAFGVDKDKLLKKLPKKLTPKYVKVKCDISVENLQEILKNAGLSFPLIAKPNIGERGINVEKINNFENLKKFLFLQNKDYLIQEYIDYPLEVGVLYYCFPDSSKKNISSVTSKNFLEIVGDGKHTLLELINKNFRARKRLNYLKNKFYKEINTIIPKNKIILLEPIGSHNRGTIFINSNHLINKKLINVFSHIANQIDGFYYGRFDLKIKNLDDLFEGKNIKILELNGVNSEPTHIYDPNYTIFKAYKDIFRHMNIIAKIAFMNRKKGLKTSKPIPFLKDLYWHLTNR